jgi:hypothetical protein
MYPEGDHGTDSALAARLPTPEQHRTMGSTNFEKGKDNFPTVVVHSEIFMKLRLHQIGKAKRLKNARPQGKATKTIPPPDDPLRRGQQESDLNTREMAEKRQEALNKIRETPSPSD